MLMKPASQYEELLPDVLPIGSCFTIEVKDAGEVYNRELGMNWTRPGEFLQFYLTDGLQHIWIMRIATFRTDIRYCVAFGPDAGSYGNFLPERMSLDELKEAVHRYLAGKLFSEMADDN